VAKLEGSIGAVSPLLDPRDAARRLCQTAKAFISASEHTTILQASPSGTLSEGGFNNFS
jgi:hypothetical protein